MTISAASVLFATVDPAVVSQEAAAVFAFLAFIASCATFVMSRSSFNHEHVNRLIDRLFDMDKLCVEHPEVQKFLYEKAHHSGPFFMKSTPHDELYFKTKAVIYSQI